MTPPTKKTQPSCLLYSLIGILVLILLCAGATVYLVLRNIDQEPNSRPNATNLPIFLDNEETTTQSTTISSTISTTLSTTTDGGSSTTGGVTITTESSEIDTFDIQAVETENSTMASTASSSETTASSSASMSTSTETITTAAEAFLPEEDPKVNELVAKCAEIEAVTVSCSRSVKDMRLFDDSTFNPLHYNLNLSIRSVQPGQVEGNVQIFVNVLKETDQLTLHAASNLRNTDRITVVHCETGKTLCVSKQEQDQRFQTLSLLLDQTVKGAVRIQVSAFVSVDNHDVVYSQVPPRWHRGAPTLVGSLAGASKKLFPCMDHPSYRSTFSICMTHANGTRARSNGNANGESLQTCFEKTPPLSSTQIAFATFDKSETLVYNATDVENVQIPSIEIIFSQNKNFKREKHEWIYNETSRSMSEISKWTKFPYPLSHLSLFSAPIPYASQSAFGLVTVQDRMMEYPNYKQTHITLIRAIIGQWLGSIVATLPVDNCFEESLTTYLELRLNEKFGFANRSRSSFVWNSRPRDLSSKPDEPSRYLRSLPGQRQCDERYVSVFYTIEETYGSDCIEKMLQTIFSTHAFKTATIDEWAAAVSDAASSTDAGDILSEWFGRQGHLVLKVTTNKQNIDIQQLTTPWTIPVELVGSEGSQLLTLKETNTSLPFSSRDYAILDPKKKSTAIVIYDVDSYTRLMRCWDDSRCPADHESIKLSMVDLGAVLLADLLEAPQLNEVSRWKALFQFMNEKRLLEMDSSCCISHAVGGEIDRLCTWTIRDICPKIRFLKPISS